ncbi:hypothetical protein Syun_010017 [Stephania yunnanensis]|uniref:Uncharacterized protein n=1 Tax=Stephania yunnanensis TaxID=152371 RepID=A0AAP0KFN7_9MAGN
MIPETQSRRSQRRPAAAEETARIRPAAAARCPMNGITVAEEWRGSGGAPAEQWRAAASLAEKGRGGACRGGPRSGVAGRAGQGRGAQGWSWAHTGSAGRAAAGLAEQRWGAQRRSALGAQRRGTKGAQRRGWLGEQRRSALGELCAQRRCWARRAGAGRAQGCARAGANAAARDLSGGGCGGSPAVVAEGLRRWWRVGSENGFGGEMGLER